jgi:ribosomal protein S6--L-glutamate ligase
VESASFVDDKPWTEGLDVVVAGGGSWGLLALLGWAESIGLPTINRRVAIANLYDKTRMSMALARAGLPTPPAFLAQVETLTRQVPADEYPLVIKSAFGESGQGLHIVYTPEELSAIFWLEPLAMAQRFVLSDGFDLKLYGIGERIIVVRAPSSLSIGTQRMRADPQVVPTTQELEKLGRACMRLFGLELCGVDCVQTAEGPIVVGIDDFPSFAGVPDIDDLLVDHVVSRTRASTSPRPH